MNYEQRLTLLEASFNIKPFLDVADKLKSLDEVTGWVKQNNFDKHGHCQNIAALYAYVANKFTGIATGGHVAFLHNDKVYDPIYFKEVPTTKKQWQDKFPNNKEVNLIKLK